MFPIRSSGTHIQYMFLLPSSPLLVAKMWTIYVGEVLNCWDAFSLECSLLENLIASHPVWESIMILLIAVLIMR